jgi:hypothetical protein
MDADEDSISFHLRPSVLSVFIIGESDLILASKQAGRRGFIAESSPRAGVSSQLYPMVMGRVSWSRPTFGRRCLAS